MQRSIIGSCGSCKDAPTNQTTTTTTTRCNNRFCSYYRRNNILIAHASLLFVLLLLLPQAQLSTASSELAPSSSSPSDSLAETATIAIDLANTETSNISQPLNSNLNSNASDASWQQAGSGTSVLAQNYDFVDNNFETSRTDDLEAGIRNAVKSEIELDMEAGSSPILEVLKDKVADERDSNEATNTKVIGAENLISESQIEEEETARGARNLDVEPRNEAETEIADQTKAEEEEDVTENEEEEEQEAEARHAERDAVTEEAQEVEDKEILEQDAGIAEYEKKHEHKVEVVEDEKKHEEESEVEEGERQPEEESEVEEDEKKPEQEVEIEEEEKKPEQELSVEEDEKKPEQEAKLDEDLNKHMQEANLLEDEEKHEQETETTEDKVESEHDPEINAIDNEVKQENDVEDVGKDEQVSNAVEDQIATALETEDNNTEDVSVVEEKDSTREAEPNVENAALLDHQDQVETIEEEKVESGENDSESEVQQKSVLHATTSAAAEVSTVENSDILEKNNADNSEISEEKNENTTELKTETEIEENDADVAKKQLESEIEFAKAQTQENEVLSVELEENLNLVNEPVTKVNLLSIEQEIEQEQALEQTTSTPHTLVEINESHKHLVIKKQGVEPIEPEMAPVEPEINPDIASNVPDSAESNEEEKQEVKIDKSAESDESEEEKVSSTTQSPTDASNNIYSSKGSRSVHTITTQHAYYNAIDESAATLLESFAPRDADRTLNDNLADERADDGVDLQTASFSSLVKNRSTLIIALCSATAVLFIVISLAIFLVSFQRQHGTLDIEMQEQRCGKESLEQEDAQLKLLEIELPPQTVTIGFEETDECL